MMRTIVMVDKEASDDFYDEDGKRTFISLTAR
jgi:hypothetical protein